MLINLKEAIPILYKLNKKALIYRAIIVVKPILN